jgi:hypothetical protein
MLPKFRPATSNGRETGAARPVIRPVKPTAPPPPPAPPSPRRNRGRDRDQEAFRQAQEWSELPTMAAARERIHALARELPRQSDYDDETEGRIEPAIPRTSPHGGAHGLDVPFDALPSLDADDRPSTEAYHEPVRQPEQSAPALRGRHEDSGARRRPDRRAIPDAYEVETQYRAPYTEGVPETDGRHAALAYCRTELHEEISPAEAQAIAAAAQRLDPRSEETSAPRRRQSERPLERLESHERSVPRQVRDGSDADRDARRQARDVREMAAVASPASPRLRAASAPMAAPTRREDGGRDVPAGFVVGVQPLRTAPQPFPHEAIRPAPTPALGIVPGAFPAPATVGASPRALPRAQTAYTGPHLPHRRVPTHGSRPGYVASGHHERSTEYDETEQSSKVGRFAWFVFGAAFGIFFAFFATSFVGRVKKDEAPPAQPAAQGPALQAPAVTAPAVHAPAAQAPTVQPVAMQPVEMQAPVVQAPAVPAPVVQAPVPQAAQAAPVQAAPVIAQPQPAVALAPALAQPAPAASPPAPRAAAPRYVPAPRPQARPPVRRAVRDDEERTAAPPKDRSESVGDLLNAGLGP